MHIYTYIYIHAHINIHMHVYKCTHTHIRHRNRPAHIDRTCSVSNAYTYTSQIHTYIYIYVHIYLYTYFKHIYICISNTCLYLHIYQNRLAHSNSACSFANVRTCVSQMYVCVYPECTYACIPDVRSRVSQMYTCMYLKMYAYTYTSTRIVEFISIALALSQNVRDRIIRDLQCGELLLNLCFLRPCLLPDP